MKLLFLVLFSLSLVSCDDHSKAVKIKGSDTEVNLTVELAEKFHSQNPDFSISISGGGSGLGIASLFNHQADIANSSRPLKDEEEKMFLDKNIKIVRNIFAEDATAIIVNSQNTIGDIDVETLALIFSGKISNWKSLTGKDIPINIYGRQSNSGTHSFVQKKLNIRFSSKCKEMNGNAQIIEGVKEDFSGIGYVGAGYLISGERNKKIKVLKIKSNENLVAVSPLDNEAIQAKKYFLQRPLYQYIPSESLEKVKPFLEFEKSEEAKDIIRKFGYYVID